MKITDILKFEIKDNYIESSSGNYFFYRVVPPNLSILTNTEKTAHIHSLNILLKSLPDTISMQIFCLDQTEDLSENIAFFENMSPIYNDYKESIIDGITKNSSSKAIQRGFYFVVKPKDMTTDIIKFDDAVKSANIQCTLALKQELTNIMRSFLLRDFKDFDIAVFEDNLTHEFNEKKTRKKKKSNIEQYTLSAYTKALLPTSLNFKKNLIEQSDFMRQVLLIKNFPLSFSKLAFLSSLTFLSNTTVNIRLVPMNKYTAITLTDKQLKSVAAEYNSAVGTAKIDAKKDYDNVVEFYNKFTQEEDIMYYVNVYIEIYGKNLLELDTLRTQINNTLDLCSIELLSWQQEEGYRGICPICHDKLLSLANNVPSKSLSAMYPFTYSSRADKQGIFLGKTADNGFMFLDFYKRDRDLTNGNTSVIGSSGMGKSFLVKKILSQYIMAGKSVYMFDHEAEYVDLFDNLGGMNIEATSPKYIINPLEIRQYTSAEDLGLDQDVEFLKTDNSFKSHLSWLSEFLKNIQPDIGDNQLNLLNALISDMYFEKNISEDTDFSKLTSADYPIFSDLFKFIEKVIVHKKDYSFYNQFSNERLADCQLTIKNLHDGSLSTIFNGKTNLPNSKVINFNIQQLNSGDANRTQAYMYNISTFLASKMFARENEMIVAYDELALFCTPQNFKILVFLKSFAQRIRKYRGLVLSATQQLSDLMMPQYIQYTSALFNLSQIKFIFNVGEVDTKAFETFTKFSQERIDELLTFSRGECLLSVGVKDKYKLVVNKLEHEQDLFGSAGG